MCDSYRLALDWEDGVAAPASVVAKCPSHDEASRNIAKLTGTYVKEVSWYRELAAGSRVAAPRCYHAEIADVDVDFVLLLSHLAPARQGAQLAGPRSEEHTPELQPLIRLPSAFLRQPKTDTAKTEDHMPHHQT